MLPSSSDPLEPACPSGQQHSRQTWPLNQLTADDEQQQGGAWAAASALGRQVRKRTSSLFSSFLNKDEGEQCALDR